jgi:hypothetical protein
MIDQTAVVITAWRRPYYLERTLQSWAQVPEITQVPRLAIALGRHERQPEMLAVIADAEQRIGRKIEIIHDSDRATACMSCNGTIPEAADLMFADPQIQFFVLGEEDLVVSDDALTYMNWCAERFADDQQVLTVNAFIEGTEDADPSIVRLRHDFRGWVWGTWRNRWEGVLSPQWDWDAALWKFQSGHDWHIDRRIMPAGNYLSAAPDASRVQNIGQLEGFTANPSDFPGTQAPSFRPSHGRVTYRLGT